jgi:hypothetical protein
MGASALLPEQFSDLEAFAQIWALPTANERCDRRLIATMEEMTAFYEAVLPRGDEIFAYLDTFDYPDLPDTAEHLVWLLCALSVVSFSVDVFKQARVPDAGEGILPITLEPAL